MDPVTMARIQYLQAMMQAQHGGGWGGAPDIRQGDGMGQDLPFHPQQHQPMGPAGPMNPHMPFPGRPGMPHHQVIPLIGGMHPGVQSGVPGLFQVGGGYQPYPGPMGHPMKMPYPMPGPAPVMGGRTGGIPYNPVKY